LERVGRACLKLEDLDRGLDEPEPYNPPLPPISYCPDFCDVSRLLNWPFLKIKKYCAQSVDDGKEASLLQSTVDTVRDFPLEVLDVGICTRGSDTYHQNEEVI
jgi:hypothetical protein